MINIQDIIPFMKKGWVARDDDGRWYWYKDKPKININCLQWQDDNVIQNYKINGFDIAPADDWTKSLIKIDNTTRKKFKEEYQNNILKIIQELK